MLSMHKSVPLCAVLSCALALGASFSASAAEQNTGGTPDRSRGGDFTASGDRWAVVNSNATFARGKGVVQVTRGDTATGSYIVKFNKVVTGCMYQATIGLSGISGVSPPGEVTVVRRFSDARAVYVTTHTSAGAQADRGFHLYVGCK
jgi:hypothetical protein